MKQLMAERARQATVAISMACLIAMAGATHAAGAVEPAAPAVRLSVSDVLVVEGDQGARGARTTISLSSPLDADLEISYRTVDGSAVAGSDYRRRRSDRASDHHHPGGRDLEGGAERGAR